ncbi:MAG: Digeranylgeranylglyceryl phosphate synthase [Candidatus Heimdallarchaeota archaeon LC_2]|nr:MAG: Digeranylgeranylglyceryl phosphate synthase [Candidatus Heimdallarchaeota archaeon LC_2]
MEVVENVAIFDLLKMIRPPNAFMVTAMAVTGIWFASDNTEWWLYVLAIIVANAYIGIAMVHNDIIDLDIDKINAPHRALPSGKVSLKQAKIYAIVLFIIGTIAGLGVGSLEAIIIMSITLILSLLYNSKLKQLGFLGNITVGVTATSAFLYGDAIVSGWDHFWPISTWNASIYLFLISAILNTSREVAKGIMDTEGDREYGIKTIAVLYGKFNAARLVLLLILVAIIVALLPLFNHTFGPLFILAAGGFVLLLLRQGIPLLKDPNYNTAKKFKNWLLPNMFIALVIIIIDVAISRYF